MRKFEIKQEFSRVLLKNVFYIYLDETLMHTTPIYSLEEAMEKLKEIKQAIAQAEPTKVVYEEIVND